VIEFRAPELNVSVREIPAKIGEHHRECLLDLVGTGLELKTWVLIGPKKIFF